MNYILDIIVFIAFVAAVMFVGLWKSKGEDTHGETGASDYFLAGRGLSWWLIGFSLIAANISAEQFVGMSGQGAGFDRPVCCQLGMDCGDHARCGCICSASLFLENRYHHDS